MSRQLFKFQRGEIYLVEEHSVQGSEQKKTRPWILIGATAINVARSTVVALPLSSSAPEKPPLSIKIYANNSIVCALLDQIRALDKNRFIHFEGVVSLDEMDLIDTGLRQVLSL